MEGAERPQRGLAAERTALAWNRSGLAVATIAGVIAKAGAEARQTALGLVAAGVLLALALGVWAIGGVAYSDGRRKRPLDPADQRAALRFICAVSVLSATIAFVIALMT